MALSWLNKNTVCGDKSAMNPGGVRLGTPALTTRGFKETDFEQVVVFIKLGLDIGVAVQNETGPKLVNFTTALENNAELTKLEQDVESFALSFPMAGISDEQMLSFKLDNSC